MQINAWDTGSEAKTGVGNWMEFYNRKRPHSALGGKPPASGLLAKKWNNQPRSAGAKSSLDYAKTCPTIGE